MWEYSTLENHWLCHLNNTGQIVGKYQPSCRLACQKPQSQVHPFGKDEVSCGRTLPWLLCLTRQQAKVYNEKTLLKDLIQCLLLNLYSWSSPLSSCKRLEGRFLIEESCQAKQRARRPALHPTAESSSTPQACTLWFPRNPNTINIANNIFQANKLYAVLNDNNQLKKHHHGHSRPERW